MYVTINVRMRIPVGITESGGRTGITFWLPSWDNEDSLADDGPSDESVYIDRC
jgi:hypothetical protein